MGVPFSQNAKSNIRSYSSSALNIRATDRLPAKFGHGCLQRKTVVLRYLFLSFFLFALSNECRASSIIRLSRLQAELLFFAQSEDIPQESDVQIHNRHILNQLVYRQIRYRWWLSRIERLYQQGQVDDALLTLQEIIGRPDTRSQTGQDSFVWNQNKAQIVTLNHQINRIFERFDQKTRKRYEELVGRDAKILLKQGLDRSDNRIVRKVIRCYFHTAAGFEACDWLATRQLDAGYPEQSARIWNRLIRCTSHHNRITHQQIINALTAFTICDQSQQAASLIAYANLHLHHKPNIIADSKLLTQYIQLIENRNEHRLTNFRAQSKTNRGSDNSISAPYQQPIWTKSFGNDQQKLILQQIRDWQSQQKQRRAPFAVANRALVTHDQVIVRDFSHIRAYRLSDGKTLWSYPCATSLESVTKQVQARYGKQPEPGQIRTMLSVSRAYAWNSMIGSMSCDHRYVYAIDSFDLSMPRSHRAPQNPNQEHQVVSRHTNRLIALPIVPATKQNSSSAQPEAVKNWPAWSIGGSAALPTWFLQNDQNHDRTVSQAEFTESAALFAQYDKNQDGKITLTEAVRLPQEPVETGNRTLQNHFFLGPPLSVADRLYVITEASRELFLNALNPRSGELIWQQGIGFVTTPISEDHFRYGLKCSPQYAQGMILCPTQTGILVAVDPIQGNLLWMNYYGDDFVNQGETRRRPVIRRRRYNHPGFPEKLHIRGNRIVYLPRQSQYLHCINLQTGKLFWKAKRNAPQPAGKTSIGDEYIGAVTNELILLIGGHRSRALDLEQGSELWSLKTGLPSGIGLLAGTTYLLPIQAGVIEQIDLKQGTIVNPEQIWQSPVESSANLARMENCTAGHLHNFGDVIVVSTPSGVSVLPQIAPLQKMLASETQLSEDQQLLLAELHIRMGQFQRGQRILQDIKKSDSPENYQFRANELLIKLTQAKWRLHRDDPEKLLQQWSRIVSTPLQRAEYLMNRANYALAQHDLSDLQSIIADYAQLHLTSPIPDVQDPTHLISSHSWIIQMIRQMRGAFGSAAETDMLSQLYHLRNRFSDPLQLIHYQQLLARLPYFSEQLPVTMLHVDQLTEQNSYQQAELILLQYQHSSHPELAAWATHQLAEMWVKLGLYQNAARLVPVLTGKFADFTTPNGQTGRECAEQLLQHAQLRAAYRQTIASSLPVRQMTVSFQRYPKQDADLKTAYAKFNRILPTSHQTHVQVLERPRRNNEIRLAMVEKQAGVVTGNVKLPRETYYPHKSHMQQLAHFYPIGSRGKVMGISLLNNGEHKPIWTNSPIWPYRDAFDSQSIRVGPTGPSYCVIQTQQELVVLDPLTGHIKWQRTRLEPNSGLFAKYYYMLGDEHVLTVFESDGVHYTTYDMQTGHHLRKGELQDLYSTRRRVFGRKLFYLARGNTDLHVKVWDPLQDRIELDEPVRSPRAGQVLYAELPSGDDLAFIKPDGDLHIYNVMRNEMRLVAKLKPQEFFSLNQLLAFEDAQRFYIVLQRNSRAIPIGHNTTYANDIIPPALHVHGDLYAFDKSTQLHLWKRTLARRTVLHSQNHPLPFLITLSRITDRSKRNQQSLLLEIIDANTGKPLVKQNNIPRSRIMQTRYNPEQGRLLLRGIDQEIVLNFNNNAAIQTVEE